MGERHFLKKKEEKKRFADFKEESGVSPMEVRLSGKETDAKEVAPRKAPLPMEVRPSGKDTDAKEVAP